MATTTTSTHEVRELGDLPVLISCEQAAAIRGNSAKFIRDQCRRGTIRATKLGESWRINRDSFLRQCGLLDD